MNRRIQRRLKRLRMCYYFGKMYKILETRLECQASYDYRQRYKKFRHDPYGKSVVELLDRTKLNEFLNSALEIKSNL